MYVNRMFLEKHALLTETNELLSPYIFCVILGMCGSRLLRFCWNTLTDSAIAI